MEVNGSAGYEVCQSVNGAKLALHGKTDLTSYKDATKLIVGSKYSYCIRACKGNVKSAFSTEKSLTIPK